MSTLIIQNGETSPPGLALETLRRFGHSIQMVKVWNGESLPEDLGDVDAILSCGGEQSARNDVSDPAVDAQCAFLARAHEAGVPILGLCLGAQILARALGGTVESLEGGPECGFTEISLNSVGREDPLFKGIPWKTHQFSWHEDAITSLPTGGVTLASSRRTDVQAFLVGTTSYGLQYHPEYGAGPLEEHCRRTDAFADSAGGSEALMAELADHGPNVLRHADRFFESVALFLMPADRIHRGVRHEIEH